MRESNKCVNLVSIDDDSVNVIIKLYCVHERRIILNIIIQNAWFLL